MVFSTGGIVEKEKYLEIISNIKNMLHEKGDIETIDYLREQLSSINFDLDNISKIVQEKVEIDDASIIMDIVISTRKKLREKKDWEASDFIRDALDSSDIILEDSDQGTIWRLK